MYLCLYHWVSGRFVLRTVKHNCHSQILRRRFHPVRPTLACKLDALIFFSWSHWYKNVIVNIARCIVEHIWWWYFCIVNKCLLCIYAENKQNEFKHFVPFSKFDSSWGTKTLSSLLQQWVLKPMWMLQLKSDPEKNLTGWIAFFMLRVLRTIFNKIQ